MSPCLNIFAAVRRNYTVSQKSSHL